ncbi:MAG: DUF3298 and DUF4163 domain-containing protein [Maribacter sp.]
MKYKLPFLLFCFLIIGCENKEGITFEPYEISNNTCENCTSVHISIPKALNQTQIAETINTALREEIISLLNFDEQTNIENLQDAITSFSSDYKNLNEKFPEESTPWEAKIEGEVTFESKKFLTIKLDSYIFTGGAHGYSTVRFLNFDVENGLEIENDQLVKNHDAFFSFAEQKFREHENIPENSNINSTGFMFEEEVFTLPANMGYALNGIQLFYEPYEIASYADGPILLTIPFAEANPYLNWPILP